MVAVPSGTMRGMGAPANIAMSMAGTIAHKQARTGHEPVPNANRNSVEMATVPSWPQQ